MSDDKKCACGMPLSDETECKCEKGVCIHCCNCADDCECDCKAKAEKDNEGEEEGGCAHCAHHDDCCGDDK